MVQIAQDEVRFLTPKDDSLKAYLSSKRFPLALTELDSGDLVVGGSPEQLWRELGRFLAHPGVVDSSDPTILKRVPAP